MCDCSPLEEPKQETLEEAKQRAMPDITKCKGTGCPIKEKCYRYYSSESGEWQSWFTESPIRMLEDKSMKCDMYWGKEAESIWNQLKEITGHESIDRI